MAKKPPRPIGRSTDIPDAKIAGGRLRRIDDPRQPELFRLPFIDPAKPKLVDKLPAGDRWQYEIKHDGYRAQCHVSAGHVRILTKRGLDIGAKLPGIVGDLEELRVRDAIIDGEAVVLDDQGISDWHALHAAMAKRGAPDAVLFAFDLLHLQGEDLRKLPLTDRRARLTTLLEGAGPHLLLSEHHVGDSAAMLQAACEMGLEGIVAKRRDAPYRSGYVDTWLKAKCTKTDHFAVIGFDPHGRTGVRSLKLARLVDDVLTPCGWAGSGITEAGSRELRTALDAGMAVAVEVQYRGISPAGELRHPVVKGWVVS